MAKMGLQVGVLYVDNRGTQTGSKSTVIEERELDGFFLFKKNIARIPKLGRVLVDKWATHHNQLYEKYIEKHGRPDLIHAHGYIAGFAARRLSSKYGLKLVLTLHESDILKGDIKPWHKTEFDMLLRSCHSIICVSEKLRNRIDTSFWEKIVVIPNLIDESLFFVRPSDRNTVEILVLGNLTRNKRVDLTIRSFAMWLKSHNQDAVLKIVGNGPTKGDLEKLARKLEVNSQVQFIEEIALQEVPDLLSTATLLMTMSEVETFGKVIIESLACGVPVIAAKSADPEEIVKEGMGKRVSPNLQEITAAMKSVISGEAILTPEEISQYALIHYGSNSILPKITAIYRAIPD